MTEKRFYIGNGENCTICDSIKGGSDFFNMLTQYEAVDRLNELFDENEQLKQQISDNFNQSNCITVQKSIISDLKKENEQLKQTNQRLTIALKEIKEKTNIYLEMTKGE